MPRLIFQSRSLFRLTTLLVVAIFVLLTGCSNSIGDECESRGDCPSGVGAICDNTVEGGYCTVPNCQIGGCPDDSACVIFDRDIRFCMAVCEADADCREGYACRTDNNFAGGPIGYCYVPQTQAPPAEQPAEE
jgi:hypothetical protein